MKSAYETAKAEAGTWEWADGHNPKIVQWFADVGHDWVKDDETAWCAAFVGAMLKAAGLPHTGALNARSYLDWGKPVPLEDARPGDVVILWRGNPDGWQGHVAFFDKRDGDGLLLLGGNQRNQVNVSRYPVSQLLGVRRMERAPRAAKASSTTLQASAGGAVATVGAVGSVIGHLDPSAQIALVAGALVVLAALGWIARERIRKWAAGDR